MNEMKRLCRLSYLALHRLRLCYARGVVCRVSTLYQKWLSRALLKLSRWDCQYQDEVRRFLIAISGKEL